MNKEDKDILSAIKKDSDDKEILAEEDDVLINELFTFKNAPNGKKTGAPKVQGTAQPKKVIKAPVPVNGKKNAVSAPKSAPGAKPEAKPVRSDARYTMTDEEIETLAAAAEDAVADGRYGAALDSVFFTAGAAREALREKLNIRIPLGSSDTDLPVIAAAALIDSYLEYEDINGANIEEKLRLIIESSEDEYGARPSEKQVELRVFECALILCVQAEQSGRHAEIKNRLYGDKNSFLCTFLDANTDNVMKNHRKELTAFYTSVKLQSRAVSEILEERMASSKYSSSFIKRFFAESKPVIISAAIVGALCLVAIIFYIVGYGSLMSFVATDTYLIGLFIVLELLLCAGMLGISWLVYTGGEYKEEIKKSK